MQDFSTFPAWFKRGRFWVTIKAGPGAANSGRCPLAPTVSGDESRGRECYPGLNHASFPHLTETTQEVVERMLLDCLTCPGEMLKAPLADLCRVLAEVDYDREGLAQRAGLAVVSLHAGERQRRWEIVRRCALEVATPTKNTPNQETIK
jgi:hypothetical protein